MKRIRLKLIFLAALSLLAAFLSLPTFMGGRGTGWWARFLATHGMRLGLDLQGGLYVVLKVDLERAIANRLDQTVSDLKESLRRAGVAAGASESIAPDRVRLDLAGGTGLQQATSIVAADYRELAVVSSSETASRSFLVLSLRPSEVQSIRKSAMAQSMEIVRNRVDQFGIVEPVILQQGSDEVAVQLPGLRNPSRAVALIGRTAQLSFKIVDETAPPDLAARFEQALQSGRLRPGFSHQELNQALKDSIPAGDELYLIKEQAPTGRQIVYVPILLKQKTLMTGEAIKTARVAIGGQYNQPYVAISLNSRGTRLFARITRDNVGRRLAIILDNVVQSAPVIQEPITGGNAEITGAFTTAEADDLAIVLRAGALPAPVSIIQNLTVGPTLGRDSIRNGIAATILGALLVIAFMWFYYRVSGLIADLALLMNLLLMVAALSMFGATLTLPGIAGIVLSMGMAVDSNVLIFERMREESGRGAPLRATVMRGYDKAYWTIIDAHVTTLITAFALFLFGTGPIKGFAVTLSIGVIFNLFTALVATRAAYDYLLFRRVLHRVHFLHIIRESHISFIRMRKAAFVLSAGLVAMGVFAIWQIERGHGNLGVDFTGGTMVQFKAAEPFQLGRIRIALDRHGLSYADLQEVPSQNILIVRAKSQKSGAGTADRIASILAQDLPGNHFSIQSKTEIGASISGDLRRAAYVAIAISLLGIVFYLALRFDIRFGAAAAVATFHDVMMVLGTFYFMHKEITLLVVTALLTLAGYSLTDTVVVFDRIRENMRLRGAREDVGGIIDLSINEVLSRTLITSGTVILVLIALLLLGGPLLHDFALALLIGVFVGTYSSIFVASPIVYIWPGARRSLGK